jgi:phosphoribosylamine-glycine ligase
VVVAATLDEAHAAIDAMLVGNSMGDAGTRIVIEEFLAGEEASFIVMIDGGQVLPLASSQDHKRLRDGDRGPNTGGMGAYSPAPVVTPALHARIMRETILPVINGMADEGIPYTGFLYAGVMVDAAGNPKCLNSIAGWATRDAADHGQVEVRSTRSPAARRQWHTGASGSRMGSPHRSRRGAGGERLPGKSAEG